MAMFDWNGNGKKNDREDNLIEYEVYKDIENKKDHRTSDSISSFCAILSCFAGLFLQVLMYDALGIEVEDVPAIVLIFLWMLITFLVLIVLLWICKKLRL